MTLLSWNGRQFVDTVMQTHGKHDVHTVPLQYACKEYILLKSIQEMIGFEFEYRIIAI